MSCSWQPTRSAPRGVRASSILLSVLLLSVLQLAHATDNLTIPFSPLQHHASHTVFIETKVSTLHTSSIVEPFGLAISEDGKRLFAVDRNDHRIVDMNVTECASSSCNGYTIAGGPGSGYSDAIGQHAAFADPHSIVLSADGQQLYVSDTLNNVVRVIEIATGNTTVRHP